MPYACFWKCITAMNRRAHKLLHIGHFRIDDYAGLFHFASWFIPPNFSSVSNRCVRIVGRLLTYRLRHAWHGTKVWPHVVKEWLNIEWKSKCENRKPAKISANISAFIVSQLMSTWSCGYRVSSSNITVKKKMLTDLMMMLMNPSIYFLPSLVHHR